MSDDNKTIIEIDVTDWANEYLEGEPNLSDEEALINHQMETGKGPLAIARDAIIAHERGDVDNDGYLPENKALLNSGGAVVVSQMYARAKRKMEVAGRPVTVRKYVAGVYEHDERHEELDSAGDSKLVESGTREGAERAAKYLRVRVPNIIYQRLLIILDGGGDVRVAGEEVIARIKAMISELEEAD